MYCRTIFNLVLFIRTALGGGRLIIGQEQDDLSTTFNPSESYNGRITLVQVWDRVLLAHEILAMHTFCEEHVGNLVSWPELRFSLSGDVNVENSSFCNGESR